MFRYLLLLMLTLPATSHSQELLMETDDVMSPDVSQPKFQGGDVLHFYNYVVEHFDNSTVTKKGNLVATFIIAESGDLKDIRIVEFIDATSARELIRVLQNAPKWQPAIRAGKPFSVKIKLPLRFK